jgi:DNA invertase Pin-like site-specific DNA recombinase
MIIGYARVSTLEQNLELQLDALSKAGCDRTFEDHASGAKMARPGLEEALSHLRKGDVLVIWKLDRLGRTIRGLIELIGELRDRGIGFKSLTEGFDTSTPGGRLIFHIFAALAEMERDLIRERTQAGLAAARARGRNGGRKPKLSGKKLAHARELLANRDISVVEVAATLGVDRSTLYRALARRESDTQSRVKRPLAY